MLPRLERTFFRRDPVTLARALLGQRLVRIAPDGSRRSGLIVETEAYLGVLDRAAHTFGGRRTARNASMWLDGGHAYVYFTYGLHYCFNVVCEVAGEPTAVLLRALQPEEGIDAMRVSRGPAARQTRDLCSGPARLCQALAIDRSFDGTDLCTSETLFLEATRKRAKAPAVIGVGPRVGIGYAEQWAQEPLRFWVKGSEHVSR